LIAACDLHRLIQARAAAIIESADGETASYSGPAGIWEKRAI